MDEVKLYNGRYRVKVVTKSVGYVTIEALEEFHDVVDGKEIIVKIGDQRIVPADTVENQILPPMVEEHEYELNMENKVKQMVAEEEKKEAKKKQDHEDR